MESARNVTNPNGKSLIGRTWHFIKTCSRHLYAQVVAKRSEIPQLEREEETRRQDQESAEAEMSDTTYKRHVQKEYGEGKWADKVTDELVKEHHDRSVRDLDKKR